MSVVTLLEECLKTVGIGMSKLPNWEQRKRDKYFSQLARYKYLCARDSKYTDQEELLRLEHELEIFVKAYGEELKK